jgi:hypothetical protein
MDVAVKIGITNNGFSFIPAFTLEEPATSLDIQLKWKRFSIEPQFQYSLEGKPWSFVFFYRYKTLMKNKYLLTLGSHLPALAFVTEDISSDEGQRTRIVADRIVAGEIINTFVVNPKVIVGLYYIYSRGVQTETLQNGHYLSFNATFPKIRLSEQINMIFSPQVFYLRLDERDGFYVAANLNIAKSDFPVSFGSTMYKLLITKLAERILTGISVFTTPSIKNTLQNRSCFFLRDRRF